MQNYWHFITILCDTFVAFSCVIGAIAIYFFQIDTVNFPKKLGYVVLLSSVMLLSKAFMLIFGLFPVTGVSVIEQIVYIVVFLFLLILIIVIFTEINAQNTKKTKKAKEAAEIAKHFGDTKITMFHFPDRRRVEEIGDGGVYALVEFDYDYDDYSDLSKHRNYQVIESWTEKGMNTQKMAVREVEKLLFLLPYSVRIVEAEIDISDYLMEGKNDE